MKKIFILALAFSFITACSNDDDNEVKEQPKLSFDYKEDLSGDLSSNNASPTNLPFVVGQNIVTSDQSPTDPDYFTFTVPSGHELTQIVLEGFQSSDDAGFIGIVNGNSFPKDDINTQASDLLGGFVYGLGNIDNNILASIGTLNGAQGFTGALPAGSYSVWLNQTGAGSEAYFKFVIEKE